MNVSAAIAKAAVDAEKATGCPAELLFSQCALESGWLTHSPQNNCFGIKAYTGCPGKQLLRTREWFDKQQLADFLAGDRYRFANAVNPNLPPRSDGRREYSVQDWFASFSTLSDCFKRRAEMWGHGRYAASAAAYAVDHNIEQLVHSIAPIYATDPHYAGSVLSIINDPKTVAAIAAAKG